MLNIGIGIVMLRTFDHQSRCSAAIARFPQICRLRSGAHAGSRRPIHLHGTDARGGGTINAGSRRRETFSSAAHDGSCLRTQPGGGMWTRSRRAWGMLGVFYPGTSSRLTQTADGTVVRG
jgi:hypothetical protein